MSNNNFIEVNSSEMLCFWFLVLLSALLFYRLFTGKKSNSVRCLVGQTAIVTGGNDGIGYAIAVLLASRGCKVIIADIANSEESRKKIIKITRNENIFTKYLDLSSFASIRKFAEEMKDSENKIDILINNAGINGSENHVTEDGLNNAMQVNYLGAFLLTHLLLGPLKAAGAARIIFTGSIGAFFTNLSVHNLSGLPISSSLFRAANLYCNSKLCDILAAQEFGNKLKKYNITANAADPWAVKTKIMELKGEYKWFAFIKKIIVFIFFRDPKIGAQTAFHLATSEEMEGKTGGSFFICSPWIKPWKLRNPDFCREIWEKSEELVHLRPEEKI